jgi:uncharacterized coiled-coil DUF342 family protein
MTAESVHEDLFALARQHRRTLSEMLDRLDDLKDARDELPKEATILYSAANGFLQQYAPGRPNP